MDAKQVSTIYVLCCGNWRREPSEIELTAWEVAFEDADGDTVAATVRHMMRDDPRPAKDRAFMPRPNDILDLCRRVDGDIPPTLDEAVGLYLADDHSHPLVAAAVASLGRMRLDPHQPEVATAARFEFRNAYAAVLARHEDDLLRPAREAIEAGTPGAELMALLAGDDS
jgi:hypothetical protein